MQEVPKPVIFLKMEVMVVLIIAAIVLIGTAIIADQVMKLPIQAVQSHVENLSKLNTKNCKIIIGLNLFFIMRRDVNELFLEMIQKRLKRSR